MEAQPTKTWKPTVAGILNIIDGAFSILAAFGLLIVSIVFYSNTNMPGFTEFDLEPFTATSIAGVFVVMAIVVAILAVLEIIGGIFALQRKAWGLALAGSIAAALPLNVIGILSIIFLAMGKNEFK